MSQVTRLGCCLPWVEDDFDEDSADDCVVAMHEAHAFLHGELSDEACQAIRTHLMACEACMDYFEAEETITALLRRCSPPESATRVLRVRVESMHVSVQAA